MKSGIKLLSLALLFVGLILVNYLASSIPTRLDVTAERIYTLSPGTKALLGKLQEPVELDFYFSRSARTLPISIKNYADRVREMLREYARAARGKITLNFIDPKPDTSDEEKATAAGISPQVWPSSGAQFYFGLVAIEAEHQKVIPALTGDREQFLEYDLSQLIYEAQQVDRRKLGLLTSLPLQPQMDFMAMQSGQMPQSQLVISEWEKTFELVTVEPSADALPANLDVLAIIHPQNLSKKLQFAIDQFLLSGKPVFIAVDPSSRYFRSRGSQTAMFGGPTPNVSSDLPDLFKGWGIVYDPQNVIGDPEYATPVQVAPGNVVRYPIWLNLTRRAFNGTALPTSQLDAMLLVEAGSFSLKEGTGLTFTPLIRSSASSGDLPGMAVSMAQPEELGRQITASGQKTIAALIQGTFHSAFPEGLPPDEKPAAAEKGETTKPPATPAAAPAVNPPSPAPNPETKPAPHLTASAKASTLLLIADTDWLFDDYSVRRFNFLGVSAAEPLNDNLDFASNAIDFLSGSSDLISIRGKGASVRPFKVVHDMEVTAQRKYQEQLTALEAQLSKVEGQLTELEGKKTEGGRLVATPEVTKAIEDFRLQQVKLRAERREIRKSLREGIEALENRLLLLNLFATPVLVGGFGLWFYYRRRK
ncbi:MAG TPA: GldG family protein [Opitutaceae bacterium]|nr:GldG family protein [Opitutaceae bacterium]